MTMLSSSSPVSRDHDVGRAGDPGALEHEELGRVAVAAPGARTRARAARSGRGAARASVTSWPMRSSVRARLAPTLPPPATIGTRIHRLSMRAHLAGANRLGEDVDRVRGRADRAQAARGVELRARRVEHADDDAVDAEELLRDLADRRCSCCRRRSRRRPRRRPRCRPREAARRPSRGRRRSRRPSCRRAGRAPPRARRSTVTSQPSRSSRARSRSRRGRSRSRSRS